MTASHRSAHTTADGQQRTDRQHVIARHRVEGCDTAKARAQAGAHLQVNLRLGGENIIHRGCLQVSHIAGLQRCQQGISDNATGFFRQGMLGRTALGNGALEQALGPGRTQQGADRKRPGRLTTNGDP